MCTRDACTTRRHTPAPHYRGSGVSLGEALAAQGDAGTKVASCRRSLELDPENHDAEWKIRELLGDR